MIVVMSQYSYLLQCFHKYILEKYWHIAKVKGFHGFLAKMIGKPCENQQNNAASNNKNRV